MKIQLITVNLEMSARAKRAATTATMVALAISAGAVADASVPHTWSEGETLTAASLNTNMAALDGRIGAHESRIGALERRPSIVRAHKNAEQTIAAGTMSVLTFSAEVLDVNNEFVPTAGSFTASRAGYYTASCVAMFNGNREGCGVLDLLVNGSSVAQSVACGVLGARTISVTSVVRLEASDALSCAATNQLATNETIGGAVSWQVVRNYLTIAEVR